MRNPSPAIRSPIQRVLRAAATLGLIAWLCHSLDWRELGAPLHHLEWVLALAACAPLLLSRWLTAIKWRVLLRTAGLRLPSDYLFRVVCISQFFDGFLPSFIGADGVRFWALSQHSNRGPEIISSLAIERLTGAVALVLLCVPWALGHAGMARTPGALPLVPLIAIVLASVAFFWVGQGRRILRWLLSQLHGWPGIRQFLRRVHEVVGSYRQHPGPVLVSLALALLVQLMRVASVFLVAKAMGFPLSFSEALVILPPALLVSLLPIFFTDIGVKEGAFVVFSKAVGLSPAEAVGLSLVSRAVGLVANLQGAVLFLKHGLAQTTPDTARTVRARRRPLRVLRVIDRLGYGDRLRGPGRLWLNTLSGFDPRQCQVLPCVLRPNPAIHASFARQGIQLHALKKGRFNPMTVVSLYRLMRRRCIDVLHLEEHGSTTLGRLAGLLAGVPAIIHLHDQELNLPWYITWMDRWLARSTVRAVAVSRAVAEAGVRRRSIPRERMVVIPNAVMSEWAQPVSPAQTQQLRRELRIPPGCPVIGTVTRFHPVKDVPTFLRAVARLRADGYACHTVIVGDGPGRPFVESERQRLHLVNQVHLVGFRDDVRPYLALMDVVAFSSLSEGLSIALLEAMTMGRPIVVTAVEGMTELVRDDHNGLVVPLRHPQAMARAIERLLDDPGFAKRLAAQAKEDATSYEVPEHVAQLQTLYEDVVQERVAASIRQETK